ncbi:hypothetical protein D3C86_1078510 [compost metagenome]
MQDAEQRRVQKTGFNCLKGAGALDHLRFVVATEEPQGVRMLPLRTLYEANFRMLCLIEHRQFVETGIHDRFGIQVAQGPCRPE